MLMEFVILFETGIIIHCIRDGLKVTFQLAYYRQKLASNGIEDTVKDITLMEIFRS